MQRCRGVEVQRCRGVEVWRWFSNGTVVVQSRCRGAVLVQRCRGCSADQVQNRCSEVQRCRDQRCTGAQVQRCRAVELQRCEAADIDVIV